MACRPWLSCTGRSDGRKRPWCGGPASRVCPGRRSPTHSASASRLSTRSTARDKRKEQGAPPVQALQLRLGDGQDRAVARCPRQLVVGGQLPVGVFQAGAFQRDVAAPTEFVDEQVVLFL